MSMPSFARRAILLSGAALAAAGLVLATASPAFAAGRALPSGDQLFMIECDADYLLEPQLYSVDAPTAAVTKVGEGTYPTAGERCALQAAHDVTTGKSYFVDYLDLDGDFTALSTIDTVTGQSAIISQFFIPGDPNVFPEILSIAIGTDGAAFAIDSSEDLYRLNLATAELTFVATIDVAPGEDFWGFASDPTSGVFYIARPSGTLFTLNVATGAATAVYDFGIGGQPNVRSLQVDSAGVVWMSSSPTETTTELWSTTNAVSAEVFSGVFLEGAEDVVTQSLLLIPGPALANTGSEFASVALIAGLGILTLGGALVLMRRRAKTV